MSNFFQNAQNQGFWNHDFWFLSRGKKATENYCLYECKQWMNEKMKESTYPLTQYWALLLNMFATLRQCDSSVAGKNGELLNWNLQATLPVTEKMLHCTQ